MDSDDKNPTKIVMPVFCQISFDYGIEIAGIKANGSINKIVSSVHRIEQFTEEVIQREIQSSINDVLEKTIKENPAAFKGLDGEQQAKIDVNNVNFGCYTTNLHIKR